MLRSPTLHTLITLPARLRRLHARRRSMAMLIARGDEHLIDDIGLTREDLHLLLSAPDPADPPDTTRRSTGADFLPPRSAQLLE